MKTTVHPLADRLLIQPAEAATKSKGGLFIPENAQHPPQEGTVLAVGPGGLSPEGAILPMRVTKGQHVLYGKFSGTEVTIDNATLVIIREADVLAVLEHK